jgi:DNA helicase-2/ATP-dependent DNA helicase PcrA
LVIDLRIVSRGEQDTPGSEKSLSEHARRIIADEESILERVQTRLSADRNQGAATFENLDVAMIELRDLIAEAKEEDISSLVDQMHQVAALNAKQGQGRSIPVDPANPYFGHLRLQNLNAARPRTVLIGKRTLLDSGDGLSIVDWRNAPVSRLFYRYEEGDDYEEEFDDRVLEGRVLVRRSLTITQGKLRRIDGAVGTYVHLRDGTWREQEKHEATLSGGLGSAARIPRGQLGVQDDEATRQDKRLQEITALIDKEQFALITRPDAGIVLIQGGAGSGKTTVALHRVAYLAYQDPRRFAPARMLVMVFNEALVEYIRQVLPALGVEGVAVSTYRRWTAALLRRLALRLPSKRSENTPEAVTRFKKHPIILSMIEDLVREQEEEFTTSLQEKLEGRAQGESVLAAWSALKKLPLALRVDRLYEWLKRGEGTRLEARTRAAIETMVRVARQDMRDVVGDWIELVGSSKRIEQALAPYTPDVFSAQSVRAIIKWCTERTSMIADELARANEPKDDDEDDDGSGDVQELKSVSRHERVAPIDRDDENERERDSDEDEEDADDQDQSGPSKSSAPALREPTTPDPEDDAIILRIMQVKFGGLVASDKRIDYSHIVIDEAQDLCPLEMRVLLDCSGEGKSVTIAGDRAQKMIFDNGFQDWPQLLEDAGLKHVAVQPLKITYRSTRQVMELARFVLGDLARNDEAVIAREGAPVSFYAFGEVGEAVLFLAQALRTLMQREPNASVALITRYPQQAEIYYEALRIAEVPKVRLVTRQDFTFQPGIDVTDVRHVKGLEFDYVVVLDPSAQNYPDRMESRHLLHIACTRTAYQLWLVCSGKPSPLLPDDMIAHGDWEI